MLGGEVVVVKDRDAAERSHGDGHGGLGDGVHGRGDAGDRKVDVPGELGVEIDSFGGEVDVVREEDDVIVGVGEALVEEAGGGEAVFDGDFGHGAGSCRGRGLIRVLEGDGCIVFDGIFGDDDLKVEVFGVVECGVFKSFPAGFRFGKSRTGKVQWRCVLL